MTALPESRFPTRSASALFWCKAILLTLRRSTLDRVTGIQRHPQHTDSHINAILAESRTPLWTEESAAERALQRDKAQNLHCALRRLDVTSLPAGALFSFRKQAGRATRRRQITPEQTPDFFDGAKKSLEIWGDPATGWSLGWKINLWARLRDGDHALRLIRNLLTLVEKRLPSPQRTCERIGEGPGVRSE